MALGRSVRALEPRTSGFFPPPPLLLLLLLLLRSGVRCLSEQLRVFRVLRVLRLTKLLRLLKALPLPGLEQS